LLDYCGGMHDDVHQVIVGGPMMGQAQKDLDVPTVKGTSGVVVFTEPVPMLEEDPCIRCGRCLDACPQFLNPSLLATVVRSGDAPKLDALNVRDCCECASCSWSCPSHIPLVQLMRVGKAMARQQKAKS